MPLLDGLGLLKAIREGVGGIPPDTKVILLTGHAQLDLVGPALQLELDAFLAKPVSRAAMEACLRRLFDPAAARPSSGPPEGTGRAAVGADGGGSERKLALADVPAGAELARDILFSNGRLLLRSGTRLSARGRDRLGELLTMAGVAAEVWIRA
jgi:CheY-like chemotaxis protein